MGINNDNIKIFEFTKNFKKEVKSFVESKDGTYTCYFINFWTHSSLNLVGNKKLKINPIR